MFNFSVEKSPNKRKPRRNSPEPGLNTTVPLYFDPNPSSPVFSFGSSYSTFVPPSHGATPVFSFGTCSTKASTNNTGPSFSFTSPASPGIGSSNTEPTFSFGSSNIDPFSPTASNTNPFNPTASNINSFNPTASNTNPFNPTASNTNSSSGFGFNYTNPFSPTSSNTNSLFGSGVNDMDVTPGLGPVLKKHDDFCNMNDITDIRPTNNPKYVFAKYLGVNVVIAVENNYINISELCFGIEMTYTIWSDKPESAEFVSRLRGLLHKDPIIVKLGATYAHPVIAERIMRAFSPSFGRADKKGMKISEARQLVARDFASRHCNFCSFVIPDPTESTIYAYLLKYYRDIGGRPAYRLHITFDRIEEFDANELAIQIGNRDFRVIYEWSSPTRRTSIFDEIIATNMIHKKLVEHWPVDDNYDITTFTQEGVPDEEGICMDVSYELVHMYYK